MKPGPVGTFRASCKRLREDYKDIHERRAELERLGRPTDDLPEDVFCRESFDNFPAFEAHMKAVHPKAYREQRRTEPKVTGARRQPWGRPAVKLEKQTVTPGTEFVHNGRDCQVVGAVSATRAKFLVWLPEGKDPAKRTAQRVAGQEADGMIMWEVTAPTEDVVKAVGESAK